MTEQDASSGEMDRTPRAGPPGQEADGLMLDIILDGQPLPADAPPRMLVLADRLADLAAAAGPAELPGQAAALAAFSRACVDATSVLSQPATRPLSSRTPRLRHRRKGLVPRARLAAAVAVLVVAVSGTAAAYAGALPASVQDLAHKMIGAPPANLHSGHSHGKAGPGGTPAGTPRGHKPHPGQGGRGKGRHLAKGHAAKAKRHASHGKRPHHGKPVRKPHPTKSPSRNARAGS